MPSALRLLLLGCNTSRHRKIQLQHAGTPPDALDPTQPFARPLLSVQVFVCVATVHMMHAIRLLM